MADNDKPNTPGGPDFMARLRENINERAPERATVPDGMHKTVSPLPMPDPPEEVRKYAPLSVRREHKNKTRNQTIAEFIIAFLTGRRWRWDRGSTQSSKLVRLVVSQFFHQQKN
jgi:hypothetical protein